MTSLLQHRSPAGRSRKAGTAAGGPDVSIRKPKRHLEPDFRDGTKDVSVALIHVSLDEGFLPMSNRATEHHIPTEVRAAIGAFLNDSQLGTRQFAMKDAMDAVRRVFPDLQMSDEELEDAITSEATALGHDIRIDEAKSVRRNSLDRWEGEGGAICAKPLPK